MTASVLCEVHVQYQRGQPLGFSNLEILFWTSTPPPPPTEFTDVTPFPPPSIFFGIEKKTHHHQAILQEKHGSICQGLQLVKYSSNQTRLYSSNKEETLFFLFATSKVHHARK